MASHSDNSNINSNINNNNNNSSNNNNNNNNPSPSRDRDRFNSSSSSSSSSSNSQSGDRDRDIGNNNNTFSSSTSSDHSQGAGQGNNNHGTNSNQNSDNQVSKAAREVMEQFKAMSGEFMANVNIEVMKARNKTVGVSLSPENRKINQMLLIWQRVNQKGIESSKQSEVINALQQYLLNVNKGGRNTKIMTSLGKSLKISVGEEMTDRIIEDLDDEEFEFQDSNNNNVNGHDSWSNGGPSGSVCQNFLSSGMG